MAPFTSLLNSFTGLVQDLGAVKAVCWVTSDPSPHSDIVNLFAKTTTDALYRPDSAVFGSVFEQYGVAAVVQSAQGVGVS